MTRFRVLVAAGLATALTIGTLAAPAAAATKGRIIIVNGFPGTTAELCLGKKEIRSTFKYGKYAVIRKDPGGKVLKLRKKAYGTCKGKILAKKWVNLQSDDDLTLVFTRKDPKAVLFPNPSPLARMITRNGSDIGVLNFNYEAADGGTGWFKALTAFDFEKGEWGWGSGNYTGWIFWARLLDTGEVIANPISPNYPVDYRYEAIVVGTGPWNAKIVSVVVKAA